MAEPTSQTTRGANLVPLGAIVAAASLFGTLPFFAKTLGEAGMAAPAIAFCRFALTALVLLPCVVIRGPHRKATLWAVVAGAAIGTGWIGFVESLNWLTVPAAGIVFMTFPVFSLVLGVLVFGERLSWGTVLAAALILAAGALAAGGPSGILQAPWQAIVFALAAPVGYSVVLNVVAHKLDGLSPLAITGSIALGGVLGLTPLVLMTSADAILPTRADAFLILFVFSALTAFIPQLVMTLSVPLVGAGRSAAAASVELPATFLTAALLLGEAPSARQWLAGGIIVGAIVISGIDQARQGARP
ncbi:MAG: DMT family transporter [Pseudomonadota bacterium]